MNNTILFKKWFFVLCIFLTSCSPTQLDCNIEKIDSFEQAQHTLNTCDAHTIITFDVDHTLIAAQDALANSGSIPSFWFIIQALIRYPYLIKQEHYLHTASIIFAQAQRFVIEPLVIKLINQLQGQGCIVVGLTAMESGELGIIKNMPEWRYSMLSQFGIQFTKTFPDIIFDTLPSHRGNYPILYNGILCTNQQPKGTVLKAFLEHFNLKPERIISFDDSLDALKSISKKCTQADTQCIGYWYQGAQKVAPRWNTQRALKQLDHLVRCNAWISDAALDGKNV